MTIKELIKELEDFPMDATVSTIKSGKELLVINCKEPITLTDDETGDFSTGKEWVITL